MTKPELEEKNLYMVIRILLEKGDAGAIATIDAVLEWVQKRIREKKSPESAISVAWRAINDV